MINRALINISKKKSKKEIESEAILEFVPLFKFNEVLKISLESGGEENCSCPICLC